MLAKEQRLSVAAFAKVFATGKRLHLPQVSLVYVPSDTFRAAVVVGKKVAKKAVDRNTLRRRVYTQLREITIDASLPVSVLVLVKPDFGRLAKVEQRQVVEDVITRLRGVL